MNNKFTAVLEKDEEWYIVYSPEVPGANGQRHTQQEALQSLADAIALIREDRHADGLYGLPDE